jgi:hypothetical protein
MIKCSFIFPFSTGSSHDTEMLDEEEDADYEEEDSRQVLLEYWLYIGLCTDLTYCYLIGFSSEL